MAILINLDSYRPEKIEEAKRRAFRIIEGAFEKYGIHPHALNLYVLRLRNLSNRDQINKFLQDSLEELELIHGGILRIAREDLARRLKRAFRLH